VQDFDEFFPGDVSERASEPAHEPAFAASSRLAPVSDEGPPKLFPANPRFRFRRLLGQGGLGVVFLAFDRQRRQEVALKRVTAFGADAGFQTRGEFRVLADVYHPNMARVLDLFVDDFGAYFTMEYVDGGTFDAWVRGEFGPPMSRADRLLQGARSLFRALDFLHGEGLAHGDVKPSNLLVTRDGVLKLVDFGLVRNLENPDKRVNPTAGTPLYLPQEAFFGNTDVKTWDWYAAGLTLFEATLGRMPFPEPYDDFLGLAVLKTERLDPARFPRPREVPGWFVDLLFELLDPEPGRRPSPARVLQRVGEPGREASVFVGRSSELAVLAGRLQSLREHGASVVEVTGPSGIGKTSLIQHFLRTHRDRVQVLPARCREAERVPFNALDAAIDALSRAMMELGPAFGGQAVPRDAAELLALFPVLRAVGPLQAAALERPLDPRMSPREQRQRGATALRQLLETLSRTRPLALWIDDAQWADRDSLWLLGEVLRPPRVPAMMVLLCVREDALADWAELAQELRTAPLPWYHLDVAPLVPADAAALARSLLGTGEQTALAVAREAGGSPFFIRSLARLDPGHTAAGLGEVVARHVAGLSPGEQRLLALCALAGNDLPLDALLEAADRPSGGRSLIDGLVLRRLLRMRRAPTDIGPGEQLVVELTHSRVEDGVRATVLAAERPHLHGALADALRAAGGMPDRVVFHLAGAGRRQEAASEAWQAAVRAEQGLAFEAAVYFYTQAAELGAPVARVDLDEARARCLVYAGHLGEAGQAFEQAAAAVEGEDPVRALELGRRAAEQYLHCGEVARGKALFQAVLEAAGVAPIRTAASAEKFSKLLRFRLGLGGYRARGRPTDAPLDRRQQIRLDAMWTATTSLALVNHQIADAFSVLHLDEALATRDAERQLRALATEAAFLHSIEHWLLPASRGEKLLRRVLALATDHADPYSQAWVRVASGVSAWHRARWRQCVAECDLAERIFASQCQGVDWERTLNGVHRLTALAQLGDLEQLAQDVPEGLRRALARGDHFGANHHRQGHVCILWLAGDAPAQARRHLEEAARTWEGPAGSVAAGEELFSTHHYHHLLATTQVDLYEGEGGRACARMLETWPRIEAARFPLLAYCGAELEHLLGRAALAKLQAGPDAQAEAALTQAIRRLERRKRAGVGLPFSALLKAAVQARAGDRASAADHLRQAIVHFEELGMALYVLCARLRLAGLKGEPSAATEALRSRGVRRPERLADVLAPGFPL
jgi:hypothetical protein